MNRVGYGALLLSLLLACNPHDKSGAGFSLSESDITDNAEQLRALITLEAHGSWSEVHTTETEDFDLTRIWVEARVANFRFDKRIFVELDVPYDNGARIRFLAPLAYYHTLADGKERWGTDDLVFYPNNGPNGAILEGGIGIRLRLQHTGDDGNETVSATPWQAVTGFGKYAPVDEDPWSPTLSSPHERPLTAEPTEVFFSPFEDIGLPILQEIQRVIEAFNAAPKARHTIHAAVFNLSDPDIVEALIYAHQLGIEVRLVTEATKLRPWHTWMQADDLLLSAGVPVLAVDRPGQGAMHVKIGLFNGESVTTGSANWQPGARFENHENLVLSREPTLVEAYAHYFEALSGGVLEPSKDQRLHLGPQIPLHEITGNLLDQANSTIELAMFTAKAFSYWQAGKEISLFEKLINAVERGVEVTLLTDFGISEASEYYGVVSEDDQTDEWLESKGIQVVRVDNTMGRYASMHHKFLIIDRERVATGAYNWYYDASFLNDEDLLILDDEAVVADYQAEFFDLLWRYSERSPSTHPRVATEIQIAFPHSQWGQALYLSGSLPELGNWDPDRAIALNAKDWPLWTATVQLPAGVRFEWKLITENPDGTRWWHDGSNQSGQAPISDQAQLFFSRE